VNYGSEAKGNAGSPRDTEVRRNDERPMHPERRGTRPRVLRPVRRVVPQPHNFRSFELACQSSLITAQRGACRDRSKNNPARIPNQSRAVTRGCGAGSGFLIRISFGLRPSSFVIPAGPLQSALMSFSHKVSLSRTFWRNSSSFWEITTRSGWVGRRSVKLVPLPGSLRASIRPP